MFAAAAVIASPPLLVPELGSAMSQDVRELRHATIETGRQLAALSDRWIVVGTGPSDIRISARESGSFSGYGAAVHVRLGPDPGISAHPELPLAALIAAWLRGETAPHHNAPVMLLATASGPARCTAAGERLRAECDSAPGRVAVLIVADGSTRISTNSPGYLHPPAAALQNTVSAALSGGDPAPLAALDPRDCQASGLHGRAAYQVLGGLFPQPPETVITRYSAAPFGVGYYVGTWLP